MRLYLNFIARELVTFLKDDELNTATKTTRILLYFLTMKNNIVIQNTKIILKICV